MSVETEDQSCKELRDRMLRLQGINSIQKELLVHYQKTVKTQEQYSWLLVMLIFALTAALMWAVWT